VIEWARKSLRTLGVLAVVLTGLVIFSHPVQKQTNPQTIRINNQIITIEIANSADEQQRGLSGRPSLESNHGMLFVFANPSKTCFWMKDVLFNLDILWFNEQQQLIHKESDVSPDTYPKNFCPPKPAKYVLEVLGGTADRVGSDPNQPFEFENYKP
jgi:uncharacterized protein